jgi:cytochrome P450
MSNAADALFVPRGADTWRDPFTMYAALRDHDPVHHVDDGDYWALSRFEDVFSAAIDAATYSSAEGLTFRYGEMEELGIEAPIVMMDPPGHTALRRVVSMQFTPARVRALEPMVREFVRARVSQLAEAGRGDVVETLLKPLPSMVVGHFLGVPEQDRAQFDGWTDAIVAANAEGDFESASDAVGQLFMYFAGLIEKRKTEPTEDMISALVHAEIEGEPVPMAQILGFCFTMVTGGNDTTTGLLSGASELLTRHPDQQALLVKEPARIKDAVEEFLRLTSPVQGLARMTKRDVEVRGTTIPAGKKVMLLYASANRDEREYGAEAGTLDITRKARRHLSFSYGPHHCIGAAAARLQARIAIEELLAQCPTFVVDADAGRFAGGSFVRRYESLPFEASAG